MTDRFARLSALLDELFDLDGVMRASRLSEIEREDAALGAEVRKLLAADERLGVLDASVAQAAPTVMSNLAAGDGAAPAPQAEIGKRVGHYRLVARVGSGGMGEVWRGERIDDFEQAVAVKLIRPLIDSLQLRERFARERRILARLDHPNIARLLDGGVSEDGTPWYAMEFVRGTDIVRYANDKALDNRARVELLLQVCEAAAHAQTHLVVHRDLKPSNILVDAQGRARVLDFGIARLMDESGDVALTGTGVRVFSPAYAAPEQIRGDAVGTAADVFALGAVLFELLTGRVPHPQRSAVPERLLAGLAAEAVVRPSQALRETTGAGGEVTRTRSARELVGDLDTIVTTALQPEPTRRYATAAQLGEDLRRWLEGRPISAQPDTAGYRMRKFVTRHRIAVGSASAVLLALIAGLGIALWQANVARQHADRADAEAQRANAQTLRAESEANQVKAQVARVRKVKEFLVSVFVQADPMRRKADGPLTLEQAFDATLERARIELANDPVLQADVFDDFGEIRANQGRFDEAMALFQQALAVAEKEYGPEHPAVAESLVNIAAVNAFSGDMGKSIAPIERAVAILKKDDGGDPLALANALGSVAAVRQSQGDLAGARAAGEQALQIFREKAPDNPAIIVAIANVAMMDINDNRMQTGEALLREAVQLTEKHHGDDSPNLWPILTSLADVSYQRSDLAEEARVTDRALEIARANFPTAHPWTAASLVERGLQLAREGDWKRGEAMMEEGIAMYDQLGSPDVASALRRKAISQRLRDDMAGAMNSLDRAWDICRKSSEAQAQICLVVRANRAMMLARTGKGDEALSEADAAVASLAAYAELFSERGQALEARAAALSALSRHDEALAVQDTVIALLTDGFGPDHAETRRVIAARNQLQAAKAARPD